MPATERRHASRTKLAKIAYIDIEPNNGGIVRDVSEEGLGFHSMSPVENNGGLHFSLREQNRRISVSAELAWRDGENKVGGLRFTNLAPEARAQILEWISQPGEPEEGTTGSTLGAAFLRALPFFSTRLRSSRFAARSSAARLRTGVRLRLTGFSGGLATGLLISLLAGTIFLFVYGHRQRLGESLIRVGQRLASSKSVSESYGAQPIRTAAVVAPPSAPATVLPNPIPSSAVAHDVPLATTKPSQPSSLKASQKESSGSHGSMTKQPAAVVATEKPERRPATIGAATGAPQTRSANLSVAETTPPPAINNVASSTPTFDPDKIAPAPRSTLERSQAISNSSPTEMFFDLGKFKQQALAQDLSERVSQLGMRTSVVQRGRLWMSSYQVLVGPYDTQTEEKKISADLQSHGIAARPFERGSRGFGFHSRVSVGGDQLPTGDLTVTWESYLEDAKVKFQQGRGTVATASGKWESRAQKFSQNEYVYSSQGDHRLLEIHFAGLDRSLVFRD